MFLLILGNEKATYNTQGEIIDPKYTDVQKLHFEIWLLSVVAVRTPLHALIICVVKYARLESGGVYFV